MELKEELNYIADLLGLDSNRMPEHEQEQAMIGFINKRISQNLFELSDMRPAFENYIAGTLIYGNKTPPRMYASEKLNAKFILDVVRIYNDQFKGSHRPKSQEEEEKVWTEPEKKEAHRIWVEDVLIPDIQARKYQDWGGIGYDYFTKLGVMTGAEHRPIVKRLTHVPENHYDGIAYSKHLALTNFLQGADIKQIITKIREYER